jgi:hypothetical protein
MEKVKYGFHYDILLFLVCNIGRTITFKMIRIGCRVKPAELVMVAPSIST